MKLFKYGAFMVVLSWAIGAGAQGRDDIVRYGGEKERSYLDGCYVALILEGWSKKNAQTACICSAVFYIEMEGYEPGTSALTGERSYTVKANLGTQECLNLQRSAGGANTESNFYDYALKNVRVDKPVTNSRSLEGELDSGLRELGRQFAIADRKEKESQKAEDRKWWSENKKEALGKRRKISECVLENIGKASNSRAVNQVRNACRELNWREDWPNKYITQNPVD